MKLLIRNLDANVTNAITSWPAALKPVFAGITLLGDPFFTITIGLAVALYGYLQANTRLIFAGILVWATLGVGAILKLLFGRERPLTEYAANMKFQTLSFPSGHTSGATIAYGLLAYLAWQMLPQPWNYIVTGVLIAIIVLIGISRIYLGAHFPSDVIAGWLLGGIALCFIIFVLRPLS